MPKKKCIKRQMDQCYYCGDLLNRSEVQPHIERCRTIYNKDFSKESNHNVNTDDLWLKLKHREYLKTRMFREYIRAKSENDDTLNRENKRYNKVNDRKK